MNAEDPGATSVEVPGQDGAVTNKLFKDCTADELRLAIQRKRKPGSSKPIPPEVLAMVELYHEAVTDRFPEDVPVQVTARDYKGMALITFKDLPADGLPGLLEILKEHLPTPVVQGTEVAETA